MTGGICSPFPATSGDLMVSAYLRRGGMAVGEVELCSRVGDQNHAVADDMRQWEGIRRICGFSDEEMETFAQEATDIVCAQERAIRRVALELDRRQRLTGEQVTRLIETHGAQRN